MEFLTILPVLDLLEGVVVRGVAGHRDAYRPIDSCLSETANALDVARAFRQHLGLSSLYVADLDAILHQRPNQTVYRSLVDDGFDIMVDAGLTDASQAEAILSTGASRVIAGLETIPGPELLADLCRQFGPNRVVFSLDLKGGVPLGDTTSWSTTDPEAIGRLAAETGVQQMIVLDLAQVGVGAGVSTEMLCRKLKQKCPDVRLLTGGGVGNAADLNRLTTWPIDAVLVASALHDGRINKRDIDAMHARTS